LKVVQGLKTFLEATNVWADSVNPNKWFQQLQTFCALLFGHIIEFSLNKCDTQFLEKKKKNRFLLYAIS
jgi:hypothetical protein